MTVRCASTAFWKCQWTK